MEAIEEYLKHPTPDYKEGLRLLEAHHRNRNLVQQLGRKENASGWAKLRYELAKLAGNATLAVLDAVTQPLLEPTTPPETLSLGELAHLYMQQILALRDLAQDSPEFAALQQELAATRQRLLALQVEPAPAAPQPDGLAELAAVLTPEALAEVEDLTQLMASVHNQKAQASNSLAEATSRADRQRIVEAIALHESEYRALAEKKRLVIERGTATPPAAPEPEPESPTLEELTQQRANLSSNLTKARKNFEKATSEERRSHYEQKAGKLAVELDQLDVALKQAKEQQQP